MAQSKQPDASCPSLASPVFCFILHLLNGLVNDQLLQAITHRPPFLTCCLEIAIHPLHLMRLQVHARPKAHTRAIKAKVDAIDTMTLKNVTVLTAHPNSFPRSSHRSACSGQMSGLEIGVRRGQVAGFGTQIDDYGGQHKVFMEREMPLLYNRTPATVISCFQATGAVLKPPAVWEKEVRVTIWIRGSR